MEPHELDPMGVGYRGAPPQEFLVCPPECCVSSTSVGASATERCRVCRQLRASFFCDECVRNGDFTHTQARYPERDREVRELEEAQQTVYVRGRWVTLAPTEGCISLVNVRLPTSGDYSQYCHWLAEPQERAGSSTPEEMRNVGCALSAGLLYAAQMVAVLAFYLDLPLPHSLCYSQFGARDESEEEFRNWVARLNSNVLHLCASQGLQPPLLRPTTTLRNLALLVQHRGNISGARQQPALLRCGPGHQFLEAQVRQPRRARTSPTEWCVGSFQRHPILRC